MKLFTTPAMQMRKRCPFGLFWKLRFGISDSRKRTPSKSIQGSVSPIRCSPGSAEMQEHAGSPSAVRKSPLPALSSPSMAQEPPKGSSFRL